MSLPWELHRATFPKEFLANRISWLWFRIRMLESRIRELSEPTYFILRLPRVSEKYECVVLVNGKVAQGGDRIYENDKISIKITMREDYKSDFDYLQYYITFMNTQSMPLTKDLTTHSATNSVFVKDLERVKYAENGKEIFLQPVISEHSIGRYILSPSFDEPVSHFIIKRRVEGGEDEVLYEDGRPSSLPIYIYKGDELYMEYKTDPVFKTLYTLYDLITCVGENPEVIENPSSESEQTLTKSHEIPVSSLEGIESAPDGTVVKAFIDSNLIFIIDIEDAIEGSVHLNRILRKHSVAGE